MKPQTLLVMMVALVFGGAAALGVFLMSKAPKDAAMSSSMVFVKADVPRGETITAEAVEARAVAKDQLIEGMLTKVEEAVDRAALVPLMRGEPLLDAKLAAKGAGRGLAALIKPGMRAFPILLNNAAAGGAGHIVPGDHVDVLLNVRDGPTRDARPEEPDTLVEDVPVLAVDDKVDAPAANKVDASNLKTVTVMLTPEQANKLTIDQGRGSFQLTLRNPNDRGRAPARPRPAVAAKVDPPAPSPAPQVAVAVAKVEPPPPPPPRVIRTLHGAREGLIYLDPPAATKASGPPAAP